MKITDILTEDDRKGRRAKAGKFSLLYHLTDYRGFSYSVSQNALKGLRQTGISFTHNPNLNGVGGRDHYHFKFIVDGDALLKQYTGHHYTSSAISIGSNGPEGKHHWNEDEIRIEEPKISPLSDFVTGLVILVPIFSRSFIQWMFYDITESRGMFDQGLSAAPRGIESLAVFAKKWNKPIMVLEGESARNLTATELTFISDCYRLAHTKLTFDDALYQLADKYPDQIKDHWNKSISTKKIKKEKLLRPIGDTINGELAQKKINQVNINSLRKKVYAGIKQMGFDSSEFSQIKTALEQSKLFSPVIAPIVWAGIFRSMVSEPVDEVIETIEFFAQREQRRLQDYEKDPGSDMFTYYQHSLGSFG